MVGRNQRQSLTQWIVRGQCDPAALARMIQKYADPVDGTVILLQRLSCGYATQNQAWWCHGLQKVFGQVDRQDQNELLLKYEHSPKPA